MAKPQASFSVSGLYKPELGKRPKRSKGEIARMHHSNQKIMMGQRWPERQLLTKNWNQALVMPI
jgi:hypothetical protein